MINIEKINKEWAPVKWSIQNEEKTYAVLMAIVEDILLTAQTNNDGNGRLYSLQLQGTPEAVKDFILSRKG